MFIPSKNADILAQSIGSVEAQQIDNLFIAPHNGVVMTYYDMLEHIRKRHDQEFNHSIMGLTTGVRMGLILK